MMNTPQGKNQLPRTNSTSKYLTPCRTFGLKRKSSSPRTPGPNLKLICKNEQWNSPLSSGEKNIKTPLQSIENKNSELFDPKNILEKFPVQTEVVSSDKNDHLLIDRETLKFIESNKEKINEAWDIVPKEKLLDIIKSINSKVEKINILKRNEIYTRKHDIKKLKESTDDWKATCKEVVAEIYKITKSRGHSLSLQDILDKHNIPYGNVGFNEEIMDFD